MRLAKLSCAQAATLARLDSGESLPRSQLPKSLLLPLQQAGAVLLEKSGSSYVVRGVPGKLANFAEQHWGIRDLVSYSLVTPENRNRAEMALIAGDSKALPTRPLDGLFFRSYNNCFVGEEPLNSSPPGTATLITIKELPRLRVNAPNLIAIENVECLWRFESVLKYFPDLATLDYALVLRWHWGNAWRNWLNSWNGQLLYFPDYDPAGLRIFVTEVLPFKSSADLLIPAHFEELLNEFGKRELFLKQEHLTPTIHNNERVQRVVVALNKTHKGLEQEHLIARDA